MMRDYTGMSLQDVEDDLIESVVVRLKSTAAAAYELKCSVRKIQYTIKRLGLPRTYRSAIAPVREVTYD